MYKKALRLTACGLASALLITGSNTTTYAAPVAGVTSAMEVGASNDTLVAGFSLTFSNYMASSELVAKANVATAQNNDTPVVTEGDAAQQDTAEEAQPAEEDPFANVAIAQVDNYVNIRSEASEDSEVLGKLYNNSAATVQQTVDGWYQITSGTVTGYVKSEYVVVGNEELARSVGRRVATVNEDAVTLFVRTEPSTDSKKLGMVAGLDDLTVTDESVDGWVKVSIEEGEGYVSADYVTLSTEFVQAESKEEEAARLAKEEAERKAAEEAAKAKAEEEKRKKAEEEAKKKAEAEAKKKAEEEAKKKAAEELAAKAEEEARKKAAEEAAKAEAEAKAKAEEARKILEAAKKADCRKDGKRNIRGRRAGRQHSDRPDTASGGRKTSTCCILP